MTSVYEGLNHIWLPKLLCNRVFIFIFNFFIFFSFSPFSRELKVVKLGKSDFIFFLVNIINIGKKIPKERMCSKDQYLIIYFVR